MMGRHARSDALFYYFRLDDQVPKTHLLRLIDKHVSFEFVYEQLKYSHSEPERHGHIHPMLLSLGIADQANVAIEVAVSPRDRIKQCHDSSGIRIKSGLTDGDVDILRWYGRRGAQRQVRLRVRDAGNRGVQGW